MFALKWPWVAGHRKGKEKMKPNDWWGDPKRKWGSLPLHSFWTSLVADGRQPFHSGLKTKDWDTRDSKVSQASIKSNTKSISPWKKRNSPVEPRQKNKISNFGTFSLYTQISVYHSLSIWKRIKAKKRHLYSWTILLHIFDTLNIYMYITVVKNLCILILPCGLCYYSMLSFQLLFALYYLA